MMNEQTKRQVIKSLAYDTDKNVIKSEFGVDDADIDSITDDEVNAEKAYYKEMGYINE
jgi:hypothetical protein